MNRLWQHLERWILARLPSRRRQGAILRIVDQEGLSVTDQGHSSLYGWRDVRHIVAFTREAYPGNRSALAISFMDGTVLICDEDDPDWRTLCKVLSCTGLLKASLSNWEVMLLAAADTPLELYSTARQD
jgi:hypothetical protein